MASAPQHNHKSLFLKYPFPRISVVMAEAVPRDRASSDWLNLTGLCLFRAQLDLKINLLLTVLKQNRGVIDPTLLSNSFLLVPNSKPSRRTCYSIVHYLEIQLGFDFIFFLILYIIYFHIIKTFPFPRKHH